MDDIGDFSQTIEKLSRELKIDRLSIRGCKLNTAAIISFRDLEDREKIIETAEEKWSNSAHSKLNIECYDPVEIISLLSKNEDLGRSYMKSIKFAIEALEAANLSTEGYETWLR